MKIHNLLLSILLTLSITACGGGSSAADNNVTHNNGDTKTKSGKALGKIKAYTKSPTTKPKPTLFDYKNAGVSGVTTRNIKGINNRIKNLEPEKVTSDKIQTEVDTVTDIADTEKPTISLIGDANITLTVGELYTDTGATANDNKDGDITANIKSYGEVNTDIAGTYTITYNVSDTAGNTATGLNRYITIENKKISTDINDTIAPSITLNGVDSLTLTVGETYTEQGAIASDNVDGNLTDVITTTGTVDTTTAGTYTINYNVSDEAGNTAVGVRRTVVVNAVVVVDAIAPILTLIGSQAVTLNVGDTYTEQSAIATDDKDGNITTLVTTSGTVDTSTAGTYTITYNVSDIAGNEAIEITRTVTVNSVVSSSPVITLKGNNPLNLNTIALFSDPGATANDAEDGNISAAITVVSTVKSQIAGNYSVTYSVEDSDGNIANAVRDVIITGQISHQPLIEILGTNPLMLNVGQTFTDPGTMGRDQEDGVITDKITIVSNTVDTTMAGTYEVKYKLVDSAGVTANATRTVIVTADSVPIVTLNGESSISLNIGEAYVEKGAIANDSQDGDITANITTTGTVDINTAGTYTITYNVIDTEKNSASAVRTVIVASSNTGTLIGTATGMTHKHIGSGVGGTMFGIAIHPTDPNKMLFSGDMGLVYRTSNGGQSWDIVPGMYEIRSIEYDPNNPNTLWAAGNSGLYKSIDGGVTWNYALGDITNYNAAIGAVAIDPDNSNIIYIAEGFVSKIKIDWVRGKVWKSIDGGTTWKELSRPGGAVGSDTNYNRNYNTIVIDPNSPSLAGKGHSKVYLVGRDGIFRSDDAGDSWNDITFFTSGQGSDMVLVNQDGNSTLFASVIPVTGQDKKGVYRSNDDGDNWQASNSGLDSIISRLEERNKNIGSSSMFVLMLAHSPAAPKRLYVGSWQGIARSNNLGASWEQKVEAETKYIQHAEGNYIGVPRKERGNHTQSFFGGIDSFIRIKASKSDADFVIFSDNEDIHITKDGGTVWKSETFDYTERFVSTDRVIPTLASDEPKNRYTHKIKSRGIQGTVNTDVAVDPFDSNIYYATYMDIGLQISRDKGESWEHPTDGAPARGHAWSVMVDPTVEGRLWVGAKEKGGIYLSTDKGIGSWSDVSIGDEAAGKVTAMAIDTRSKKNSRLLYAATENKGIYKSINGGQSWTNVLSASTNEVKLDLANQNIVYAGTNDGFYKSTDKGASWTKKAADKLGKVYNISVGNNNTLYVITKELNNPGYWAKRKLWKSTDNGESFTEISPRFMKYIGAVAINPNDANYLYIANFIKEQSDATQKMVMARSKDGGLTWESMDENFAFAMAGDIYINPKNSKQVFFNTSFSLIETIDTQAP